MDKNNYHISSVIQSYLEELDYRYQNRGKPLGLSTGIKKLDEKIGGMRGGEVVLLAARPAMGKTSFAINLSYKIAKSFLEEKETNLNSNKSVLYFSMETPKLPWIQRVISSKIPNVRIWQICNFEYGTQSYEEFEKIANVGKELEKLPIYICDDVALSINNIKDKIKEISQYSTIGFVVIDYLQLVYTGNYSAFNQSFIIIQELESIATKLNIPMLILSQLNREADDREDQRPLLSDIRGDFSNGISHFDKILFLYREYYYLQWDEPKRDSKEAEEHFQKRMEKWEKRCKEIENECEIIVGKNRYGPTGTVKCLFDRDTGIFDDLERLEDDVPF